MKVIASYRLDVLKDGGIRLTRIEDSNKVENDVSEENGDYFSNCSQRIKQILMVLIEGRALKESTMKQASDEQIFKTSIRNTSNKVGAEISTIRDKITRQIGYNAEDAKNMVRDFAQRKPMNKHINYLLNYTSNRTQSYDIIAIEQILGDNVSKK